MFNLKLIINGSILANAFPQKLNKWYQKRFQKMVKPTHIIEYIQKKLGKWRTGEDSNPRPPDS